MSIAYKERLNRVISETESAIDEAMESGNYEKALDLSEKLSTLYNKKQAMLVQEGILVA